MVHLQVGIVGLDISVDYDRFDVDKRGKPIFDEDLADAFATDPAATIASLNATCFRVLDDDWLADQLDQETVKDLSVDAYANDESQPPCWTALLPSDVNSTDDLYDFLISPLGARFTSNIGIIDDRLAFASFTYATTISVDQPFQEGKTTQAAWEELATTLTSAADDSILGSLTVAAVDSDWAWHRSQERLFLDTASGIGISMAVTSAIVLALLRAVRSWAFATMSLAGSVVTTLGILRLLGWDLGLVESITAVLVTGLSVDPVIHLAHAALEYHDEGRKKKQDGFTEDDDGRRPLPAGDAVAHALRLRGASVISGVATTVAANAVLSGATVLYFVRFGTIVLLVATASLFFALAFYLPAEAMGGANQRRLFTMGRCGGRRDEGDDNSKDYPLGEV